MSSLFSKALVYLGLVDEDQAEGDLRDPGGYDPSPKVDVFPEGRRVEPPPTSRTATRPSARPAMGATQMVRPVEVHADILLVDEFGDARVLADRVRDRVPVVLDLRRADPELVRRVIDFASGLIYALDGAMRRVGDGLVVVLPSRVVLSRDEKKRLAGLGAYELDDFD